VSQLVLVPAELGLFVENSANVATGSVLCKLVEIVIDTAFIMSDLAFPPLDSLALDSNHGKKRTP
jgi:hypothetical protein